MAEAGRVNAGQAPIKCELCDGHIDVTWYCPNCEASLCGTCKADHLQGKPLGIFKKHKVVPRVEALRQRLSEEKCPKHPPNIFVLHCDTCNELACTTCITEKHGGHKIGQIADAMEKVHQQLAEFSNMLITKWMAKCNTTDKETATIIEKCQQWYRATEQIVNERRLEMKAEVDRCCDIVLEAAQQENALRISAVEETRKQLQSTTKHVRDMIRLSEEMPYRRNSEKLKFNKNKKKALTKFNVETINKVELPQFQPGKTSYMKLSEQVGCWGLPKTIEVTFGPQEQQLKKDTGLKPEDLHYFESDWSKFAVDDKKIDCTCSTPPKSKYSTDMYKTKGSDLPFQNQWFSFTQNPTKSDSPGQKGPNPYSSQKAQTGEHSSAVNYTYRPTPQRRKTKYRPESSQNTDIAKDVDTRGYKSS